MKSKSQYIIEMQENKKVHNEIVWDYDHRFEDVMGRLNFRFLTSSIENGL
jgi:hypothetical protein